METKILWISLVIFIKDVKINDGFSLWMQIRTDDGPLKGLWEFPGGNWEPNETPVEAAVREVKEETGFDVSETDLKLIQTYTHHFKSLKENTSSEKTINFHIYLSHALNKDLQGKWFRFSFDQFSTLDLKGKIPDLNHQFIANVKTEVEKLVNAQMYEEIWVP